MATTIRLSTTGTSVVQADVGLFYDGGQLVYVTGFGQVSKPRNGINFYSQLPQLRSCAPLTPSASSPAGDLYPVGWAEQICDNQSCSAQHGGDTGKGCLAITRVAKALAATFLAGDCQPAAFPALPANWAKPVKKPSADLKKGMLDGLLVRFSGDSLKSLAGQRGVCGNTPKIKYLGTSDTVATLRKPASSLSIVSQVKFGMDVNSKEQAYSWGAGFSLLTGGRMTQIMINQTDPALKLNCKTRPAPRLFSTPLPVGIWAGPNGRTYIGQAWMKATLGSVGGAWSVLVSFGSKNFSSR
ncbi:MAG TPA: hypothetical protein VIL77_15275 [Gaiellaceae bacterium]